MKRLLSCSFFAFLFLVTTQVAQAYEPATLIREPKPFRRDEGQILGRDFEFTTTGFLDRFSYRFRPQWNEQWRANPQAYRITAGSVRSDELYP